MGVPIEGAYERYLKKMEDEENAKKQEKQTQETLPTITPVNINPNDYIFIPSSNIYIAKKRTNLDLNWYNTHKTLHEEGLLMPTIPQFINYINHLKANPKGLPDASKDEIESILDDILTIRVPWRAEWLDASFTEQNKQLYINYNHRTDSNNQLTPLNSEPLEKCLMENCYADVLNPNKQGLPLKKSRKEDIYYWYPKNNIVASFVTGSHRPYLNWSRNPDDSDADLGVFASASA